MSTTELSSRTATQVPEPRPEVATLAGLLLETAEHHDAADRYMEEAHGVLVSR
jgi:hypothetical protein